MTRTELIIQLLKVAIALAFGAYFVWWSLQVLDRLTPDYDAATTMVGPFFQVLASPVGASLANGDKMRTLAFGHTWGGGPTER